MANPFPAVFRDDNSETRLSGKVDFTDPANQPGVSPFVTGSGSPVGVVTPSAIGALYIDTTNGGLWVATGATNADWVVVGGAADAASLGVQMYLGVAPRITAPATSNIILQDAPGNTGTGNCVQWTAGAADGQQRFDIYLGPTNEFNHQFTPDGVYHNANGIIFPTADPHVAGAWWDNAGTLTKSMG